MVTFEMETGVSSWDPVMTGQVVNGEYLNKQKSNGIITWRIIFLVVVF